jgi:superoxide dismutase, Fe-Mn family
MPRPASLAARPDPRPAAPPGATRRGILDREWSRIRHRENQMAFELQPLPWPSEALGDHMSAETLQYHHGRHHRAYVDKVNRMVAGTPLARDSLVDVVHAARLQEDLPLFNNAAQVWNHNFFWQCLAPPGGGRPYGDLAELIRHDFGSVAGLLDRLAREATNHFSNGWIWLLLDRDRLRVASLHDADTPLVHAGMKPLLAIDVWEHAYYIDYRNARADYVRRLLDNLVNWDFVARNIDGQGRERADQKPAVPAAAAPALSVVA